MEQASRCISQHLQLKRSLQSPLRRSYLERSEYSECSNTTEEQIEQSKLHWSLLVESDCSEEDEEEVTEVSNVQVFKTLQMHPTWGPFFCTFNGDGLSGWQDDFLGKLVVGKKFAEGGQAEIYEVQFTLGDPEYNERQLNDGTEWVVKVLKKETFLRHLQYQFTRGYLQFYA